MAVKVILINCILLFSLSTTMGQDQTPMKHFLKFANPGAPPPSTAQFSSDTTVEDLKNTQNKFIKAERICVSGMWALYNTTDWGDGADDDATTVISVRGTDTNICTKAGQLPVLKNVRSVRFLGNADFSQNTIDVFTQPYFLGGEWNIARPGATIEPPSGTTGFALGSIAITGTGIWIICNDANDICTNGVCVDMQKFGHLFLRRNTVRDTSLSSNGTWPKTIRRIRQGTADTCSNYPSPLPPANTQRITRRSSSDEYITDLLTSV